MSTSPYRTAPPPYLLLTEFFPPRFGGIEDTLGRLAAWFGSRLEVVAPPVAGDRQFDQAQTYAVTRRSLFSGRGWPTWWWLCSWLWSRRRSTRLVIFGHYSLAVTAAWLLRPMGLRYALIVHGNDVLSETAKPFRRWLVARQLRAAGWIGTNSRFMEDWLRKFGVRNHAVVRFHPIIDDQPEGGHSSSRLAQLRLITICRLVKRKNVRQVISAVGQLVKEFPMLRYDIVGDGPARQELTMLAQRSGVAGQIVFHGQVDDATKQRLLTQADIGVMVPWTDGAEVEGLGRFYLECSAAGLAVVGSRGGGVGQAIIDGQTGRLVEANNLQQLVEVLRELLGPTSRRQLFGQAGRRLVHDEYRSQVRLHRLAALVDREQQSNPPLVSVVIPAYQSADTIGQTITDVFLQSWPKLEVTVVDDGSTDDLAAAVTPWRERLKIIRQENLGAAAARNTGAREAHGEFILFLDADMRLDSDMITTMVVALQTHLGASYAYSNFQFGPKGFRLWDFDPVSLRQRNYIHTSSVIRRSDFPWFDASLNKFQDWDLWLTMLAQNRIGLWIPRQLFRVQQRAAGMSTWLPRFVYRLPWVGRGVGSATIARYRRAEELIRRKHHLD